MTRTWSEMAGSALEAGRLWRGLLKERRVAEADLGFRGADMIVLALLMELAGVDAVVCADAPLCDLVSAVLTRREAGSRAASGAGTTLRLSPLAGMADAGAPGTPEVHVAYGVAGLIAFGGNGVRLRLLAGASPALWQCGLALVVRNGGEAAAEALVRDLALTMRGEWIDPLALYERVQVLTARLGTAGALDEVGGIEPEETRVAALERELASLKRAALVNQHLLLVEAAERTRTAAP